MNIKIIQYYKNKLVPKLDTAVLTTMVLQNSVSASLPLDSELE